MRYGVEGLPEHFMELKIGLEVWLMIIKAEASDSLARRPGLVPLTLDFDFQAAVLVDTEETASIVTLH